MRYGFDYITSGNYAGDWQELFFPVDSVVTLTTNKGDSFSGVTFSKGQSIVGPYEGIAVTSGAVIAYKRSDTERQYQGLLDIHQNAAAAYSLRKLRRAYSGAAIRVRESATSTEADIGFDSFGNLDTTALLAHTGANDGFVVTWYDQSGNSRNASSSTAAEQPQIVSSGSVITENSKPILRSVNNTTKLNLTLSGNSTAWIFSASNVTRNSILLTDSTTSARFLLVAQSGSSASVSSGVISESYFRNGSAYTPANRNELYTDLTSQSLLTASVNLSQFVNYLIGYSSPFFSMYNLQELIIYHSDQSSNRTAIESNINDFYSIYP